MHNLVPGTTHQIYATLRRISRLPPPTGRDGHTERPLDRGAISLEQVLWFVAVAVSVGVIAAILWNRIFEAAEDAELDVPVAPGG
jgi:hypothetical protein